MIFDVHKPCSKHIKTYSIHIQVCMCVCAHTHTYIYIYIQYRTQKPYTKFKRTSLRAGIFISAQTTVKKNNELPFEYSKPIERTAPWTFNWNRKTRGSKSHQQSQNTQSMEPGMSYPWRPLKRWWMLPTNQADLFFWNWISIQDIGTFKVAVHVSVQMCNCANYRNCPKRNPGVLYIYIYMY